MKGKVKKGSIIPLSSKAMLLEVHVYNKLFKNLFFLNVPYIYMGKTLITRLPVRIPLLPEINVVNSFCNSLFFISKNHINDTHIN